MSSLSTSLELSLIPLALNQKSPSPKELSALLQDRQLTLCGLAQGRGDPVGTVQCQGISECLPFPGRLLTCPPPPTPTPSPTPPLLLCSSWLVASTCFLSSTDSPMCFAAHRVRSPDLCPPFVQLLVMGNGNWDYRSHCGLHAKMLHDFTDGKMAI